METVNNIRSTVDSSANDQDTTNKSTTSTDEIISISAHSDTITPTATQLEHNDQQINNTVTDKEHQFVNALKALVQTKDENVLQSRSEHVLTRPLHAVLKKQNGVDGSDHLSSSEYRSSSLSTSDICNTIAAKSGIALFLINLIISAVAALKREFVLECKIKVYTFQLLSICANSLAWYMHAWCVINLEDQN